jgi:signal transduction histidine kinase
MSALAAAGRLRWADPAWRATALGGLVLVAALTLATATSTRGARSVAVALAIGALPVAAALLAPGAARALRGADGRSLLAAAALVATPLCALAIARVLGVAGGTRLLALAIALPAGLCGLALIGEDLRERTRREGLDAQQTPWQQLTAGARVRGLPWRFVVGVLLVGWAALVALVVIGPALVGGGALLLVLAVAVVLAALAIVGLPVLVSVAASADRSRLARTREEERRRLAAHLHDSVLQTLSLVQRQAHDPQAVVHLAHRQERALRAWMAGRPESGPDTLAGALEAAAEQVEVQERAKVAVTLNGDRPLDADGEELVAAAREALRNAARHAAGAAIVMFAEVQRGAVAVYIRDEGPGFDPATIAPERRGVRDAIVGRMAAVGGSATVESECGEGTEVTLRLPAARDRASLPSTRTR